MEWTDAQQQELHSFLVGFINPHPEVQASKLQQLDALAQYPQALLAVCAVVCDGSCAATARLSATTVARQLLRRQERIAFYLNSTFADGSTQNGAALQSLMSRLLESAYQPTSPTFPASLQRATTSLVATLLKAAAMDSTCFAAATSVWRHLLSFLLHATPERSSTSPSVVNDSESNTSVDSGACIAALLREVCELALASSRPLREWIGGQPEQCTSLCTLFSRQAYALLYSLRPTLDTRSLNATPSATLTAWTENLLAAFASCLDSGVLPCTTPDYLGGRDEAAVDGGGTAMEALRVVSAQVVKINAIIHEVALDLVLNHFEASTYAGDTLRATDAELRCLLHATAPFIAITLRYVMETAHIESFAAYNSNFVIAVPFLTNVCDAAARTQLVYDGAGEPHSIHAAVVACVDYIAQVEYTEKVPDSDIRSDAELYVGCLHHLLVCAATLPTSIAAPLPEHTVQVPDSASEMLVTSASARRRKGRHENDSSARQDVEEGEEEDDAEGFVMADAVEADLPDNGTLRHAVVWAASSITCRPEWVPTLLTLVVCPPVLHPTAQLSDVCRVEAALFVCNETLDALLNGESAAGESVFEDIARTALDERLASQFCNVVSLLSSPSFPPPTSVNAFAPFFLRVQAVRFLGRLGSGLMELWRSLLTMAKTDGDYLGRALSQVTDAVLGVVGGMEGALWLLSETLTVEVNKAVQVECIRVMTTLISGFLRTLDAFSSAVTKRIVTGESDLEEESLDDDSDDSSDDCGDDHRGLSRNNGAEAAETYRCLFFQSVSLSSTTCFLVLSHALQNILQSFPSLQWSVRQAAYHLLSEALPLLWDLTKQQQQQQQQERAAEDSPAAALVHTVTVQALEVLAAHYMALLSDPDASLFERAAVLSCMADVATAMDAVALAAVVPWIVQVAHHVLNCYAAHLAQPPGGTGAVAGVDMTDMCMVSLDLISCVCDTLLDRDALLTSQLHTQRPEDVAEMDTRLAALAAALLHPTESGGAASAAAPPVSDALPNRCVALLSLCQSFPDHPSRTVAAASPDDARVKDAFGEVRRACFAVLYDCVFLLSYPASLHRPRTALSTPADAGCGISDALTKELMDLCLREVLPCSAAAALSGQGTRTEAVGGIKAVSTRNAAASDAWLCLGALLSLWDQQSYAASRAANPCAETGPASLLASSCASDLAGVVSGLLALLADKRFVVESYLKLNMTSALGGLAVVLARPPPCASSGSPHPPPQILSCHALGVLFCVISSTRLREYAPDAASGATEGLSEAAQVLWCLGRVWVAAVQPLAHDDLCRLLAARGKDITQTAAWLLRCVSAHVTPASSLEGSFWGHLLQLWRPAAHTLVEAAQAGVFSMSVVQASALRQVAQF